MSLLEHLFLMVNICVPAFALPGLFLRTPRFRPFKALLCISVVAAWMTFVIVLTVEGLPLRGSRSDSLDLERYITALYTPLAIILCVAGLVRGWSKPAPAHDPEAKREAPTKETAQTQAPSQAERQKPSRSEPLSPLARRIVGTALMQAGQAHNEPQMVEAGQRLLARSTGQTEN
jgi:hypothetical protein